MNRHSHKLLFVTLFWWMSLNAQPYGEGISSEPALQSRNDILFYGGFESLIPGEEGWRDSWGSLWGSPNRSASLNTIMSDLIPNSQALRVSYPSGGVGPGETGTQWPTSLEEFDGLEAQYDSLYLRYYVKFEEGFDFVKGGKLPGLMGGKDSYSRSGGNQPDGTNGWTMRFMWRSEGRAVVYAYLPEGKYKEGVWGTDIDLGVNFQTNKWHCVEQFIKVNSPQSEDGLLKVWIDDQLVLNIDDVRYRTVSNDYGSVGGLYMSTFHGGSDATWAPSVNSFAQFDGFALGLERIGPYKEETTRLSLLNSPKPSFIQVGSELIYQGKEKLESIRIVSLSGVNQDFSLNGGRINLNRFSPGIYYLYLGQSSEAFEFKAGF